MGNRYHTIILVPHARARLRKWRVSNLQISLLASFLLVATLAAAFFTWGFFTRTVDSAELARLRTENEDLRGVNQSFESSVQQLQEKLADYEDRTQQLAIVAGLDSSPEGSEAGIGGGLSTDGSAADLSIEARTARLDGALDEVEEQLHEQMRWISSMPAITPARGILTSNFGMRSDPITRGRAFHSGLDIAAAPGAPVHATADGVVARAGRNGGLGKAVYLSHGYGLSTRYGHLSKIAVKPGERVKRGDVIGYVGNTGRSTGYHLHYEVHLDGKAVNPKAYLLDQPLGG
jgi:murein DD-endopeptidase MepM/ murein hydrolase activator NlpD